DGLAYEDNLFAEAGYKNLPELTKITNEKYASINPAAFGLSQGKKVALIFASGAIINGEGQMLVLGSETFTRWIRKAAADRSVAAIVVRVDSPGGSALGSDVIWHEMLMARKEKPVVVSMSGLAGSGGYWISLGGNYIIAHPQTLTGSIGVISGKFSFAGLMQKLGIKSEKIVFGKEADVFSIYREFTPEERTALKNQIRIIYQQFLERVATARNLPVEEVDRIGQGRVWTGHQALELKLVDQLGGLDTAINVAKKLAGIPAEKEVRLMVWPKKRKLFDLFLGKQTELQELIYYLEMMNISSRIVKALEKPSIWSLMPMLLY
ncbi:MAG: signal peptide peptidase SppA, partial [Candidatus Aminicenantes bacterium]|nr:signal peptide peptidase SppA [Candidatus Aminicenantes bacterium]